MLTRYTNDSAAIRSLIQRELDRIGFLDLVVVEDLDASQTGLVGRDCYIN